MEEQIQELKEQLDRIEQATSIAAKNVLNIDDVAYLTGFKKATLYSMTSRNEIPHSKKGGKLFFAKGEIEQWLMEERQMTNAEINSRAAGYIAKSRI